VGTLSSLVQHSLGSSSHRALGAYYTPPSAASYMVDWALQRGAQVVLEPSMGDGVFLSALREAEKTRSQRFDLWGVELACDTFEATTAAGLIDANRAILADFMTVEPFPVDAVVGNPPYIRLRNVSPSQAHNTQEVTASAMGEAMDPAGSLWMPFVVHATTFLRPTGRLAFVLPYEATFVRYALPMWRYLASQFGALTVIRTRERLFPDILQEAIILLADDRGGQTDVARFSVYDRADNLTDDKPTVDTLVSIEDIVGGRRPFVRALLSGDLKSLLCHRLADSLTTASSQAEFRIGYVCGDRDYFHPDAKIAEAFSLPPSSLRSTLSSGRVLRTAGLRTSQIRGDRIDRLWVPKKASMSVGERRYVEFGEQTGVSSRYKCRIRDPWYVTPGLRTPDLVLPVFAERPCLLVNDAHTLASNSLLCGYLTGTSTAEAIVAAWYTSLTLLQVELNVHSLGGGVLVMVPKEVSSIMLPHVGMVPDGHLERLDALLIAGQVSAAFELGDQVILQDALGLTQTEVDLIRSGVDVLTAWRKGL